nr:GNAT family N-acetyltransferase [Plastoroseomonas arctica]
MTDAIVRRDLLGDAPLAWLLVAVEAERLVGFATAGLVYDAERAAPCAMLLDLYVEPATRRRGHARALMAALAARGQAEGVGCLWWGVDDGDEEATAFYRAIGAELEGGFTGLLLEGAALRHLADEAQR